MTDREHIVALDKRYLWHPYTPMAEYMRNGDPLVVTHARGARLFDADGRSYIDGNSSWWTALLGHQHPRLVQALTEQAQRLCHTSLAGVTHEPAARLAEELVQVAPEGLQRVFLSDDGSTAIEVAVKIALQYWQQRGAPSRRRFVALDDAFHGETLAAASLGGVEVFRKPFADVVMECLHVPPGADPESAFVELERLLSDDAQEVAALVVEPMVQGAGGMRIYDPRHLRRARQLTREHGVLLIADEVFTGYGRTGPMWACEHAGVVPDLLCTAKGFSGGILPMAATLVQSEVFEAFLGDADQALYYGHTFCGNPLGASVAREVLAIYRDERILEHAQPKAQRIREAFEGLAALPGIRNVRALGMVAAFDMPGGDGYLERSGWQVAQLARARGVYLRPLGNVVYVAPPLNIPASDLDELLGVTEECVRLVVEEGQAASPR